MKGDWVAVTGAPQTVRMESPFGTFVVQPSRGYPRSRTFVVKLGREILASFVRDAIEARQIAEAELRRLQRGCRNGQPPREAQVLPPRARR
jgi:hypothetical protein